MIRIDRENELIYVDEYKGHKLKPIPFELEIWHCESCDGDTHTNMVIESIGFDETGSYLGGMDEETDWQEILGKLEYHIPNMIDKEDPRIQEFYLE